MLWDWIILNFHLKKKNWIQIGIKFHVLRFEIGIIFKLCSVKVL